MNENYINEFLDDYDGISDFDDDIMDPDFIIPDLENNNFLDNQIDDMRGVLCLDSDVESEKELPHVSENDPDVIECSDNNIDSSDHEGNITTKKGKKRTRNDLIWKRNISKNNRAEGKAYKSIYNKKQVPKRTTGQPCKCIHKCFTNITDIEKLSLLETFKLMKNKEKQDTYPCGLITIKNIQRHRPKEKGKTIINRQFACSYKIRISAKEIPVCKLAFCSLFGIGKSVVNRLVNNLKTNAPSPSDLRRKHLNRPNKIPEDVLLKINNHINSFPKCESHYSRCDNLNVKYLSPELNISKMHKLYLKKYEPDNFELMQKGEKIKPIVKQDFFLSIFYKQF